MERHSEQEQHAHDDAPRTGLGIDPFAQLERITDARSEHDRVVQAYRENPLSLATEFANWCRSIVGLRGR